MTKKKFSAMRKVLSVLVPVVFMACGKGGDSGAGASSGGGPYQADGGAPTQPNSGGSSGGSDPSPITEGGAQSTTICDGQSSAPTWPRAAMLATMPGIASVTLRWPEASGADRYRVSMDGSEVALVAAAQAVIAATPGTEHKFRVDAVEVCGSNAKGPEATATPLGLPNPDASAPALPEGMVTSFPDAVRFLYTGDAPTQLGSKPGAIDERRVAVVRGKVTHCDGTPAPGAKVSVPSDPDIGWTFSRGDGSYDLAVNSGCCDIGVQIEAPQVPVVQRKIPTRVHDYSAAPDVVIVPYDSSVTTITLPAATAMSARSSETKDSAGSRRAVVFFPPGVTASMTLPDGTEAALTTLHVRATEFTSDQCGFNAMPGALPAESAYTYAVELSVDEAVSAHAKAVTFSKPVALYVDNFIGFPDGTPVPTGYFDRDTQCWKPEPNGVVVKIVEVAKGRAAVDIDGDGAADDTVKLARAGIASEELEELAKIYEAGKSIYRSYIPHFSPWDLNWPYRPDGDGRFPSSPRGIRHPRSKRNRARLDRT